MKAVQIDHYGGVDALSVVDVPAPPAGPGEVVVDMRAAGINYGETKIRRGEVRGSFPLTFPTGQGWDGAGVVSAVGEGVDAVTVGDEVVCWGLRHTLQAEQVALPAEQTVPKPPEVSWEVAGSLFVVGGAAYASVRAVGAGPGDTVAVSAAAGGVGSLVVQMLHRVGADVIGIASEANFPWLRSVGARPVAYGDGLADRLRANAPRGVDAFVDCFGPDYCRLALDLGVDPQRVNTVTDDHGEVGRSLGVRTDGTLQASSAHVMSEILEMVARGEVVVPVAALYPLEKVRDAYAEIEKQHTHGKIVLVP